MEPGSDPEMMLFLNTKLCKEVRFWKIESGRGPVKLLVDQLIVLRLVQFAKDIGMEPVIRFPDKSSCNKEGQEYFSILIPEIDPVRLL
ncbi:hypothetical protein ACFX1W_037692 [Malus domestica]